MAVAVSVTVTQVCEDGSAGPVDGELAAALAGPIGQFSSMLTWTAQDAGRLDHGEREKVIGDSGRELQRQLLIAKLPRLIRLSTGALACFAATIVLASTASVAAAGGNQIEPSQKKYVSNGDYGVRNDDFGSSTWLDNNGERGFKIIKSTAYGRSVTAYPNIFRGWQWGIGTNGKWPIKVSADDIPRADLTVRQTWKGTYDASLDIWFSTYPNKTTQANGAEIMIWLSHPNVAVGGTKVRVDGTDWYLNEWRTRGHGISWPIIIFAHATPISSVKGLWLNPFFRIAESHGWLKPSWYWTGIDAGFELWKGGQGLGVSYFNVNS